VYMGLGTFLKLRSEQACGENLVMKELALMGVWWPEEVNSSLFAPVHS
jgi:hypothetical protein